MQSRIRLPLGIFYRRCLSVLETRKQKRLKTNKSDVVNDELEAGRHLYGKRSNRERGDSVSKDMLRERLDHREKIEQINVQQVVVSSLKELGFGKKKRASNMYNRLPADPFSPRGFTKTDPKTAIGAGGHSLHLASASKNWPIFKHMLPEIAFAGHSNSGKSTLVNAMVGVLPRIGPASVNERAGWTDRICFYQLGRKPPVLTLADLPGYGHAVATDTLKRAWRDMTRDYLSHRPVLSRCFVLVDSVRGLCAEDKELLRFLMKHDIPWKLILTKCDLLTLEQTAQSMCVVWEDLRSIVQVEAPSDTTRGGDGGSVPDGGASGMEGGGEERDCDMKDIHSDDSVAKEGAEETKGRNVSMDSMTFADAERLMRAIDDASSVHNDTWQDQTDNTEDTDEEEADVASELSTYSMKELNEYILPVSASTGAGVAALWAELKKCADETSHPPLSPTAVREHVRANAARALKAQEVAKPPRSSSVVGEKKRRKQ